MDPVTVTLGAATAALVVKAMEKVGEKSVDAGAAALGRLVDWLRDRFTRSGKTAAGTALANVEDVPDSPSRVRTLAEAIDLHAAEDPSFTGELKALLEQVRNSGVHVAPVSQSAVGNQNVQIAHSADASISIKYGSPENPHA